MFARYFFIVLGIISILWVGYVGLDIIEKKNKYTPYHLFGQEDNQILIINRISEVNFDQLPFETTEKNKRLLEKILPLLNDRSTLFISEKRDHLLIQQHYNWNQKEVRQFLENMGISLQREQVNAFISDDLTVEFHKNKLYFHFGPFESTTVKGWEKFDHKASAVLVDLNGEWAPLTEIYFKADNVVEFTNKRDTKVVGKQIDDKSLFSLVVPIGIKSYHFWNAEFAKNTDPTTAKSPLSLWMDKGFVLIQINGEEVLISDYKNGQNPIQVLFDYAKKDAENVDHAYFNSIELTKLFTNDFIKGFHIFLVDDYVAISKSEKACEEIVTSKKLGKTIATEPEWLNRIFQDLPKNVTERVLNSSQKESRSVFKDHVMTTRVFSSNLPQVEPISQEENMSTHSVLVDDEIADFITFESTGTFVVLTTSNKLNFYAQGKLSKSITLNSPSLGKISTNKENQIVVTLKNQVHLYSKEGTLIAKTEFSSLATQLATNYVWKGINYVLVPADNKLLVCNLRNGKQFTINTDLKEIKHPADVWVSQNKLFYGVRGDNKFIMIDADKRREYRRFDVLSPNLSFIRENQIFLYAIDGKKLIEIDQKGNRTAKTTVSGTLSNFSGTLNNRFFAQDQNLIHVFREDGTIEGTTTSISGKIESSDYLTSNKKTYCAFVDGIENNIYLQVLNGKKSAENVFEGGTKVTLSKNEKGKILITTVLDKFIIQYEIN